MHGNFYSRKALLLKTIICYLNIKVNNSLINIQFSDFIFITCFELGLPCFRNCEEIILYETKVGIIIF